MKLIILIIFAIFFGTIFWAIGGHEIQEEIPFYWQKIIGKTVTVEINGHKIQAEIVKTSSEKQKGLSNREKMERDRGMIFVNEKEGMYSFWMKEVNFPLDIIWIKGNEIVGITERAAIEPGPEYKNYLPPEPVDKILEVHGGWVFRHGVEIGQKVKFSKDL